MNNEMNSKNINHAFWLSLRGKIQISGQRSSADKPLSGVWVLGEPIALSNLSNYCSVNSMCSDPPGISQVVLQR